MNPKTALETDHKTALNRKTYVLPYKLLYCFWCPPPADNKLVQGWLLPSLFHPSLAQVLRIHSVSSVQISAWSRKYFGVTLAREPYSELLNHSL